MDLRYLLHNIGMLLQDTFSYESFTGRLSFACLGMFYIFHSFKYFRKHNFVFFCVFFCGLYVFLFCFIPSSPVAYVLTPLAFVLPLIMIYGYPTPAEND